MPPSPVISSLERLRKRSSPSLVPPSMALVLKYRESGLDSTLVSEARVNFSTFECSRESPVISVVLKVPPEPDELTPWDRILEFRKDPDSQRQIVALRRWMRKAVSSNIGQSELSEELEYLVNEYERSLKIHSMKIQRGFLETLLTGSAEIIENIAKFRCGAAHCRHKGRNAVAAAEPPSAGLAAITLATVAMVHTKKRA